MGDDENEIEFKIVPMSDSDNSYPTMDASGVTITSDIGDGSVASRVTLRLSDGRKLTFKASLLVAGLRSVGVPL